MESAYGDKDHGGHPAVPKVRQAMEPIYGDEFHEGHHAISKVRLAVDPVYGDEIHGGHGAVSKVRIAMEPLYGDERHQGHHVISKVRQAIDLGDQLHGGHYNLSKVQPVVDHEGHHSVSKVQSALESVHGDESHRGHHGISKVRSAGVDEPFEVIHQSRILDSVNSTADNPYLLDHDHQGHYHQSKVQPSTDHLATVATQPDYFPNEAHEGHVWVEKVQSFHGATSESFTSGSDLQSIPRLVALPPSTPRASEEVSESSKAASYWGFLPKFKETATEFPAASKHLEKFDRGELSHLDNMPEVGSEPQPRPLTQITFMKSSQHEASPNSNDSVSVASFKSTIQAEGFNNKNTLPVSKNHENQQKDNVTPNNLSRSMTASLLHERLSDLERVQGSLQKSATHSSPASHRPCQENMPQQPKQRHLPKGLDPKRTAQWLRELLKHREPYTPSFTRLPEKVHPRHEEHKDYPKASDSAFATRVTTFSDLNAAEAGEMNEAMDRLEQLLSDALNIANEAADRNEGGFMDDDHLCRHRNETSGDSHYPPSVHESLSDDSTIEVDREHFMHLIELPAEQPSIFVGAVEGTGHGCEAIPLRSIKRRGLAKPGMHSGNIRGPTFPDRMSSLRAGKHLRNRRMEGPPIRHSPILPMPPPDCQLKRQCRYPAPRAYDEDEPLIIRTPPTRRVLNSREVREYIRVFHTPPITPRDSSRNLRKAAGRQETADFKQRRIVSKTRRREADVCSLDGGASDDVIDFSSPSQLGQKTISSRGERKARKARKDSGTVPASGNPMNSHSHRESASEHARQLRNISLRGRSHVSIKDAGFSLTKSHRRQPIARDWSPQRKRFVAAVACISTALIGLLVGVYAGIVPSVQYYIADFGHYAILGNVGMYLGMALPTFFCWPLPLLHGRKPYILSSLTLAMPLLFPQAIAVSSPRSPYTSAWRWALLLPRAFMGMCLGFASMNFHSILTDLFGASLMSSKPHQEVVDEYDVRRHGGGLGVWLGIWTWCFIGSLSLGFLVGAVVIDTLPPSWGLYISIILIAVVLMLNVLTPEVRRSAWRRSVAEVRTGDKVSRRVARGEIMMHRVKDGPKWWGQELWHGAVLSLEMLRQPGFVIMAIYSAWIYAQVVLIIVVGHPGCFWPF